MPYITAVGTAVPPYTFKQNTVQQFAKSMFGEAFRDINRLLNVFNGANIDERKFCVPIEWFEQDHSFAEKNELYKEWAIKLGTQAATNCLSLANVHPEEIDALLFVSTTGIATPSIDAYIAQNLHLSPHIKRTPIFGLGCAGGTGGVGRAFEWAKANPTSRILLVTVELCGLTFIRNDMSKSNLVATSLFADGAAAVLISGDDLPDSPYKVTPRIIDSMSTLWKNSYDVMGWNVTEQGLKVIFSKDIPTIVHQFMKPNVDLFLSKHDLTVDEIHQLIAHPGGEKVIQAYAESLSLPRDRFGTAADILRRYGNMSSATVLFVLDQILKNTHFPHEYGLMTSLGPGFSSELVLLKW